MTYTVFSHRGRSRKHFTSGMHSAPEAENGAPSNRANGNTAGTAPTYDEILARAAGTGIASSYTDSAMNMITGRRGRTGPGRLLATVLVALVCACGALRDGAVTPQPAGLLPLGDGKVSTSPRVGYVFS